MQTTVTDRIGGVSRGPYASLNLGGGVGDDPAAVSENRGRLAARFPGCRLVWMDQVHGAGVTVVDGPLPAPAPRTDALVTASPGLALVVCVADCVPLLLADRGAGVAAAVHVGRPGLLAGVTASAVEAMVGLGARPRWIRALLGPCIGPCCYEVPAALRAAVEAAVPGTAALTRWGSPSLDLPAGVRGQLARAGVRSAIGPAACTFESAAHYSYRRDGVTGRFAGVIAR